MSTSMLQDRVSELLSLHLSKFMKDVNIRPTWLIDSKGRRLELDFYFEELKIGIEVQGAQHYVFTPFFHATYQDFKDQLARDEAKRQACRFHNVILYEIADEDYAYDVIREIQDRISIKGEEKQYPEFDFYLRESLAEIRNILSKRGKKKVNKAQEARKKFNELIDHVSAHSNLLTSSHPKESGGFVKSLENTERTLQQLEEANRKRAIDSRLTGRLKLKEAWFVRTTVLGTIPTDEGFDLWVKSGDQLPAKRRHQSRKKKLNGWVMLILGRNGFRLRYTRRTPYIHVELLNLFIPSHQLICAQHVSMVVKEYERLIDDYSEFATEQTERPDLYVYKFTSTQVAEIVGRMREMS